MKSDLSPNRRAALLIRCRVVAGGLALVALLSVTTVLAAVAFGVAAWILFRTAQTVLVTHDTEGEAPAGRYDFVKTWGPRNAILLNVVGLVCGLAAVSFIYDDKLLSEGRQFYLIATLAVQTFLCGMGAWLQRQVLQTVEGPVVTKVAATQESLERSERPISTKLWRYVGATLLGAIGCLGFVVATFEGIFLSYGTNDPRPTIYVTLALSALAIFAAFRLWPKRS